MQISTRAFLLPVFLLAPSVATVVAESAASAVQVVQAQYGKVYATRLVAVTGEAGEPAPKEWHVFACDLNNPTLVSHFVVQGGKIAHAVMLDPQRSAAWAAPVLAWDKVKVGSDQAFKIADATARVALVGFDTVDYRLMSDRQTRVPMYLLELKNKARQIVGYLKIDATRGTVVSERWPGKSGFLGPWSGQDGIDWKIVKDEMGKVGRDISSGFQKLKENVGRKLQE